jgi:hypothetical protein
MLVAMALIAEIIGVTALVGAFIFGCIVPREGPTSEGLLERLQYVITTAFVPLYFAASGLRTEFGLLNSGRLVGHVGAAHCALVARQNRAESARRAASLRACRGSTPVCLAFCSTPRALWRSSRSTSASTADIITKELFAVSIVMVLFNTFLTGPLVSIVYRLCQEDELHPTITSAKFGAEVSIIVAVGQAHPSVAGELARVASLLYGDQQDRAALHVWRVVDHLEADAAALHGAEPRRGLSRIPFLASTRRETDSRTKAAAVAAREANMKVSVKSQISTRACPRSCAALRTSPSRARSCWRSNAIADLAGESIEEARQRSAVRRRRRDSAAAAS